MENNSRVVFLFDGQGSQYYGMGAGLYHANSIFRNILLEMDEEVRRITGAPIIGPLYREKPAKELPFDDMRLTHPTIYMLQYALAMTLREEMDIHPSYVLGTNLGESVAAAVSGAADPLEMLDVIIRQADILQQYCAKGGMVTIRHDLKAIDLKPHLYWVFENTSLAAINYCGHYTLSADAKTIREITKYLDKNAITYHLLPIDIALHSPAIEPAKPAFIRQGAQLHFSRPLISFISGIDATQLHDLRPYYLWQSMREQIRFSDAIRYLEEKGKYFYIDCSPSGALQAICTNIISCRSASAVFGIMTPANQEKRNWELLKRRPDLFLPATYRNSL